MYLLMLSVSVNKNKMYYPVCINNNALFLNRNRPVHGHCWFFCLFVLRLCMLADDGSGHDLGWGRNTKN